MAGRIDERLNDLGITIPEPAAPVANYVGYVCTGNLVFISGQVPMAGGQVEDVGKLGAELGIEEGQAAARLCGLNILGHLKAACDGDLDRVRRCVKLNGYVNSAPDFNDQPKVINGVSDLMVEVFGDDGRHARAAVGTAALPLGVGVEVEAVFEIA